MTTTGGVKCWGNNGLGSLGDGTTTSSATPVAVVGLSSGVTEISAGQSHTCALTIVGGVKCWGYNSPGTLGDGTDIQRTIPVDTVGLGSGVAEISAGGNHTCALTTPGRVKCWGWNGYGQVGNGMSGFGLYVLTPVDVMVEEPPTPTPTSTPTVTPTPTSTPTLPPPSGKPVVVLIDGWQGLDDKQIRCRDGITVFPDNQNFRIDGATDMPDWLTSDGFEVWSAHLTTGPNYTDPLGKNARCLKSQLDQIRDRFPEDGAILIAHSMGGLVARAYIEDKDLYQDDIKTLITLGTPHLGAPIQLPSWLSRYYGMGIDCHNGEFQSQPALCEFTLGIHTFNEQYNERNKDVTYYSVSGDLPWSNAQGWSWLLTKLIPGKDDGIVPTSSGTGLDGVHQTLKTNEAHIADWSVNSYFVAPPGDLFSFAYSECIQPVLQGNRNGCHSNSVTVAEQNSEPSLAAFSPILTGTLTSGQTITQAFNMDGVGSALFVSSWQTGSVTFTLTKPDGQPVDPAYSASHPQEVSYLPPELDRSPFLASYMITATETGSWTLNLQAATVPAGSTDYSLSLAMDSPITLTVQTDRSWYGAGYVAKISARLGGDVNADSIVAQIQRPDLVVDSLVLTTQGGNLYQGDYTIPPVSGYGSIQVIANGTSANGQPFSREALGGFQVASTSAVLSDSYADRGEDNKGDNQFEALAVDIGVTTNVSGTFTVVAELALVTGGTTIAKSATTTDLITGTHTLTLRFDGDTIWTAQKDGPYRVSSVLLIDKRGAALPVQEASNVWTTAAYRWQDFGNPERIYLPNVLKPFTERIYSHMP